MFTKICHNQKPVICLFLLPLFLASINSALVLPLFSMVPGNSHKAYLTYEHGEIHLKLGHQETKDNHDMQTNDFHGHEHDLSPIDHTSYTSGQRGDAGHEFHISYLVQQSIATVKIDRIFDTSTPLVAIDW